MCGIIRDDEQEGCHHIKGCAGTMRSRMPSMTHSSRSSCREQWSSCFVIARRFVQPRSCDRMVMPLLSAVHGGGVYTTSDRCVARPTPTGVCCRGPLRATPVRLLWWGYKESDLHRLARERPWWENFALIVGTIGVVLISAFVYSFGNKIYYSIRPTGNDVYVVQELDEKVFSRPDLSVALVRMAVHHLMTQTSTPFGAPMVAPPELRKEAEELLGFVKSLHAEQPQFSIPDLWSLSCCKALERLGGPIVHPLRGRPHIDARGPTETLLAFPPHMLPVYCRDVLQLKKIFAAQRYSVDEAVAALAGIRNIGYHPVVAMSLSSSGENMKPATMLERYDKSKPSQETLLAEKLITQRKSTLDPYVFGGEYFSYLLDYHWMETPVHVLPHEDDRRDAATGDMVSSDRNFFRSLRSLLGKREHRGHSDNVWTCSEGRRRRVEVLVDPLSEAFAKREVMKRTLSEQEMEEWEAEQDRARQDNNPFGSPRTSLCDNISMEAIDIMLLDDAMTLGWVNRFSENELKFYTSFGSVVGKILCSGYNANELYTLKR